MAKFIEVQSSDNMQYSINVEHIVKVSQFETNETTINLSNNENVYVNISRNEVISLIEKVETSK